MRVTHTHHVALVTANFERIRAFYVDVLGFPVRGAFSEHKIVFIEIGSTTIEILEEAGAPPMPDAGGWNHIAFEVEDVDAAFAELSAQGIHFHVPPENFPERNPSLRIAFFRDPDGNLLELIQPLGGRYPEG